MRIIDTLGALIGGFFGEPCRIARNLAAQAPDPAGATVIGTRMKTSPDMAAFTNATTSRYIELMDSYHWPGSLTGHASDTTTPVLAAAEHAHADGRKFMTGVVLSYEVFLRFCDALHDMSPAEQIAHRMESGEIEIAPLAFMRGRTLAHCYVILDEAQNTTPMQMRMFLTRLGEGSRMVITGDPSQTDLPNNQNSGLNDAVDTLADVEGVRFVRLTSQDVVRHDLVTRIVDAYDARDKKAKG